MDVQQQQFQHNNRNQISLSEEYRGSLTNSLMLLENLLGLPSISEAAKTTIWLVISQINLLLCLTSDTIDHQLIKLGQFRRQT